MKKTITFGTEDIQDVFKYKFEGTLGNEDSQIILEHLMEQLIEIAVEGEIEFCIQHHLDTINA